MEDKLIRLAVNGRDEAVVIQPLATLQDVLRDKLELTAVKSGCGQGGCGSCSVLGGWGASTLVPDARRAGGGHGGDPRLEGLNETNAIVPLQQAFVENYAAQCGYCTAGMVMAAKALLDRNPGAEPRRDRGGALGQSLSLYRVRAHRPRGAAGRTGALGYRGGGELMSMKELGVVGRNVGQRDLESHARGQTTYYEDVHYPRMLHLKMHRSAEPHANIVRVDTSKAEASPGVGLRPHPRGPARQEGVEWPGCRRRRARGRADPRLRQGALAGRAHRRRAGRERRGRPCRRRQGRGGLRSAPGRVRRGGGDFRIAAGTDRALAEQPLHLSRRSRRRTDPLRRRGAGIRRGRSHRRGQLPEPAPSSRRRWRPTAASRSPAATGASRCTPTRRPCTSPATTPPQSSGSRRASCASWAAPWAAASAARWTWRSSRSRYWPP